MVKRTAIKKKPASAWLIERCVFYLSTANGNSLVSFHSRPLTTKKGKQLVVTSIEWPTFHYQFNCSVCVWCTKTSEEKYLELNWIGDSCFISFLIILNDNRHERLPFFLVVFACFIFSRAQAIICVKFFIFFSISSLWYLIHLILHLHKIVLCSTHIKCNEKKIDRNKVSFVKCKYVNSQNAFNL